MHALLDKLHSGVKLDEEELVELRRQLQLLEAGGRDESTEVPAETSPALALDLEPLPGHATGEGARRLAARHPEIAPDFYVATHDSAVSTVGLGTYRGTPATATDQGYIPAIRLALRRGVSLIDTSLNYREQRSEREVGVALQRHVEDGQGARDEVVICTKGGYLVRHAITRATIDPNEVAGGAHCMSPAFLADQIARSRRNLGVATIDVYYVHNPETQLGYVDRTEFSRRLRAAFAELESAVADGSIRHYGVATWDGLRDGTLPLTILTQAAHAVGGDHNHFRFVELPLNLGMPEAASGLAESGESLVEAAAAAGVTVIASASLLQARLSSGLPREVADLIPGLSSDAQRAIQFVRSTPNVAAALVGMRQIDHVEENLTVAEIPRLTAEEYERAWAALV